MPATDYEQACTREDSDGVGHGALGDRMEVLDIGCGNGGKAIEPAQRDGAASVVGRVIGSEFPTPPPDLDAHPSLAICRSSTRFQHSSDADSARPAKT